MNKYVKPAGVVLCGVTASASLGALAGYFLAKKRLTKHYEEFINNIVKAERELASDEATRIEDHYKMVLGEPPYDTSQARTKRYLELVEELDQKAGESQRMSIALGYSQLEDPGPATLEDTPLYTEMNTPKSEPVIQVPEQAVSVKTLSDIEEKLREDVEDSTLELDPQSPESGPTSIVNEPDTMVKIKDVADVVPEIRNIFDEDTLDKKIVTVEDEFSEQVRVVPHPTVPYLISTDEFMDPNDNLDKITLTYYSGDKILTDDAERPVDDVEGTVGEKNLRLLGAMGPDGQLSEIHVRNGRIGADFEVCLDIRTYGEAVHGIPPKRSDDE